MFNSSQSNTSGIVIINITIIINIDIKPNKQLTCSFFFFINFIINPFLLFILF